MANDLTQAERNIIVDIINNRVLELQAIGINTDSLDRIINKLCKTKEVYVNE